MDNIHIKTGEKIQFPVAADHPFAKFQTLTPVRSAGDVHEFLKLWHRKAASDKQPSPDLPTVVAHFQKAKFTVLHLQTNDLRIEKGGVLTLNNPLNQLDLNTATIAGELVVQGHLVFNCNTLTIV